MTLAAANSNYLKASNALTEAHAAVRALEPGARQRMQAVVNACGERALIVGERFVPAGLARQRAIRSSFPV